MTPQRRKRLRVTICGPACSGKSTILHRLTRFERRQRRVAFKMGRLSDKEDEGRAAVISPANEEFWLSRREDLEETKPALHLLVDDLPEAYDLPIMELLFDGAAQDTHPDIVLLCIPFCLLTESGPRKSEEDLMKLVKFQLFRWLDHLRVLLHAPDGDGLRQVLPIFTFKDQVPKAILGRIGERLRSELEDAVHYLQQTDAPIHIFPISNILFLDARKSKDYGDVRSALEKMAKQQSITSQRPVLRNVLSALTHNIAAVRKASQGGALKEAAAQLAIKLFAAERNRSDLREAIQVTLR